MTVTFDNPTWEVAEMSVERWLRLIAGTFVLITLALGYYHSPYWYLFTAFLGLNLLHSGRTNWCLVVSILKACGARERGRVEATAAARTA